MAWRAPRYCYQHAIRDVGVSSLSSLNTVHADYPLSRLIDERSSVVMKFNASESDHYIQWDSGSIFTPLISRLFIPSGHNMVGADLRLRADSLSDMSGATTLIDHTVAYGTTGGGNTLPAGDIDIAFTQNSNRYVRLDWPNDSGQWEIPELWLTTTVTLTRGPEPKWTDQKIHNAIALQKASGEAPVIETGAAQREFRFRYLQCETADITKLEAMINAVGISKPLILDPPYDDEAAIVVRLVDAVRVIWDHPVPTGGTKSKQFDLRLLQVLE